MQIFAGIGEYSKYHRNHQSFFIILRIVILQVKSLLFFTAAIANIQEIGDIYSPDQSYMTISLVSKTPFDSFSAQKIFFYKSLSNEDFDLLFQDILEKIHVSHAQYEKNIHKKISSLLSGQNDRIIESFYDIFSLTFELFLSENRSVDAEKCRLFIDG